MQQRQGDRRLRARLSRLWFTIGVGIVNEVYYPRVDIPQIRDLGFIVADGAGFWVEVKRMWRHVMELAAPGVPAVRIVHRHERFELTLRVAPCEHRDVLLIEVSLRGDATLRPYALLAPHLGATGNDNRAAVVLTAGGACCGPRRVRSLSRWRRSTRSSATPGAAPAPASSATATAGRTSRATARSPGNTTAPGPATWR